MEKSKENEELLKDNIFALFSECISENPIEPKNKLFMKLCDHIFRWCKGFLPYNAEEMGIEIINTTEQLIKKGRSRNEFLGALVISLKNASNKSINRNISGVIKQQVVFKGQKTKDIKKMLSFKESNVGKKLTINEQICCLMNWYKWDEKTSRECLDLFNRKFSGENEIIIDSDNNYNYLDVNVSSPYIADVSTNPINDYFNKDNINKIKKAASEILAKKQDRSRPCYKALFTLYCIDNIKDYEAFLEILDHEVIADCKENGEKPTQYEIYKKYHPTVSKGSAEAMASKLLKDFIKDLEKYLKEKNPEILP